MWKKIYILTLLCSLLVSFSWSSGTFAGQQIVAASANLLILFNDAEGVPITQNASEFSITDDIKTVGEINGLVETNKNTAAIDSYLTGGIYRGIQGGSAGTTKSYVLSYQYLNRGNTSEDIKISANITGGGKRWRTEKDANKTALEDALVTFLVSLNVQNPIALEDTSLKIIASLVTANNVTSYNSFVDAIGLYNGSYTTAVQYGGTDNITNEYSLEAESAVLVFLNKTYTVAAPTGYGSPADDPVPGAKVRYITTIKNTSTALAVNVQLRDKVPNKCHLYYTDPPTVTGTADNNFSWIGGSNNSLGTGGTIGWDDLKISPNATITVEYSVTID